MRKLLLLVFIYNCGFSQAVPSDYKKIKFVYEEVSRIIINENGVFADTTLLAYDFPKLKYTLVQHPTDSKLMVGFVPLKDFSDVDKKQLAGIIYHSQHHIEGEYNAVKNQTVLNFSRDDKNVRNVFKKYLDNNYNTFRFKYIIDYKSQKIEIIYPTVTYEFTIKEKMKSITFTNSMDLDGFFHENTSKGKLVNVVLQNIHLPKFVTSADIFSNNVHGISKTESIYSTTTLSSVVYE